MGLAAGAVSIPPAASYGGVGPNFLKWLVSIALMVCGVFTLLESRTGGFHAMDDADGVLPCWSGFTWDSAGLLANAALITNIGFIFSCTLCFVLAVQSFPRPICASHCAWPACKPLSCGPDLGGQDVSPDVPATDLPDFGVFGTLSGIKSGRIPIKTSLNSSCLLKN